MKTREASLFRSGALMCGILLTLFCTSPAAADPALLDVDGNGVVDALTDGVLIVRTLFGFSGATVTNGALGAGATRTDPAAVIAYVHSNAAALDVDHNNFAEPLADGVLIVRYLFGFRGDALVDGAIGNAALATTGTAVAANLETIATSPGPANGVPTANPGARQDVVAGATVTLDGRASSDPDGDALTYAWALNDRPPGSVAALSAANTATPTLVADLAGTYVVRLVVSDGRHTSSTATVNIVAARGDGQIIVANIAEPLQGTVTFSLSKGAGAASVRWFVDGNLLGTGANAGWNTRPATDALHTVVARIDDPPGTVVELRRTFRVFNSTFELSNTVMVFNLDIYIDVKVRQPHDVASITLSLDGVVVSTLTAPNYQECPGCQTYRFHMDPATIPTGSHTVLIDAVDVDGVRAQMTVPLSVSHPNTVTVTSPLDGAFVFGTLHIEGDGHHEDGSPLYLKFLFNNSVIFETSDPHFSSDYFVSGFMPGSYTLSVEGAGLVLGVVVASSPDLVYTPMFKLGRFGQLLAVEDDLLLYLDPIPFDCPQGGCSPPARSIRLRNTRTNTDIALQGGADIQNVTAWLIVNGTVYASSFGPGCIPGCISRWGSDGAKAVQLRYDPNDPATAVKATLSAAAGYLTWSAANPLRYVLYNPKTSVFTEVRPPAGAESIGALPFNLAVRDNVLRLVAESSAPQNRIFRWSSDTATSVFVTGADSQNSGAETDGIRIGWTRYTFSEPGVLSETALVTVPFGGGAETILARHVSSFILRDGVLAWDELSPTGGAVKVSTAAGTRTLATRNSPRLLLAGGGIVIFVENNKIYSWDAATGLTKLRIDTNQIQDLTLTGTTMYFTTGLTKSVYKVPLN